MHSANRALRDLRPHKSTQHAHICIYWAESKIIGVLIVVPIEGRSLSVVLDTEGNGTVLLVRVWDRGVQQFGVDEAGKGPVLGPMIAACVVGDPRALPDDIDDSKALSVARRETLAGRLQDDPDIQISVARVPTERIDDPTTDMNTLTVAAHAEALTQVAGGLSGVVDACDTNADRFARRVGERVDASIEVDAEHTADETYPLVSAASVIAKVERDGAIDALRGEYGDVGSGYPSDSTTRAFLEEYVQEHGQLPNCARTSWKTSKDVVAAVEQSSLDSF